MRQHAHSGLIIGRRGDGSIMLLQVASDDDATIGDMIVIHPGNLPDVIDQLARQLPKGTICRIMRLPK